FTPVIVVEGLGQVVNKNEWVIHHLDSEACLTGRIRRRTRSWKNLFKLPLYEPIITSSNCRMKEAQRINRAMIAIETARVTPIWSHGKVPETAARTIMVTLTTGTNASGRENLSPGVWRNI